MWQHSACLGFSQTEAEKEDFHFICADCTRRAEDAKKPKIPSLKFHIGSSSSPPSQNPQVVIPGANEGKKRKSSDGDAQLQPNKKHQTVNGAPGSFTPQAPQSKPNGIYGSPNGMHAAVMNAPKLSPQGQLPHYNAGSSQPGNFFHQTHPGGTSSGYPPSPIKPPNNTYSYSNHVNGNGYVPQLPPQVYQSPQAPNGVHQHQPPVQNVGWSARYTSPQSNTQQQNPRAQPPSQNPFANSFERQPPSEARSIPNLSTPHHNGFSVSSPQRGLNASASQVQRTPQVNGISHHQPLSPTGPPVPSPVKQSPPPLTQKSPNHMRNPSSSPVTHQPPLKATISSSPGFSPTKHSPPRPAAPMQGMSVAPVLPPAPQLSPSPASHDIANVKLPNVLPQLPGQTNGHKEGM